MKNLKNWKNFKKNEIVIYAIALMLVTAGYFNYTTNIDNTSIVETVAEENSIENRTSIGDARLVNSNEVVKNEVIEEIGEAVNTENSNTDKEDIINTSSENSDYFVSSKLERDTEFASMISVYTKILEDNTVSETQKSIAMTEITKINNNKNAISVCENLLSTKGFSQSVVLVNKDSVNVVVKTKDKLSTAQVAQIQNIISREFKVKIENIHITEKQ